MKFKTDLNKCPFKYKIVDTLKDIGVLDNTLIFFIIGDNGASTEGTLHGCFNEMTTIIGK